jgi:tetratricopeptide (TPR) repeat protein
VLQERSVEAYATLKNLSVIDPNYPGIRNMLYDAGVAMGEIIPPPSAAEIARSNQLNVSARAIIDSNVQSQFSAALEMLNEAIQLNPDNNVTAQLIDRVGILLGGTSTIMVNEDKERYNAAVREFQMGNRLAAQRIVDELLTNPRNRNSSELIQLKERIEAFL